VLAGKSKPTGAFRAITLLIIGMGILLSSLAFGMADFQSQRDFEVRAKEVNFQNLNLALALEQNMNRSFAQAETILKLMKAEMESDGSLDKAHGSLLGEFLNTGIFNQISAADSWGNLIYSAVSLTTPINISDRPHFTAQEKIDNGETYISSPLANRVKAETTIFLSRRLNDANGHFAGIVSIGIAPDYFLNTMEQLKLETYNSFVLLKSDGTFLTRFPSTDSVELKASFRTHPVIAKLQQGIPFGNFDSPGAGDGIERIGAFRRLSDYPAVVLVGISKTDAFGAVTERGLEYRNWAGLFTALLWAILLALWRQMHKQYRTKQELREANENLERKVEERTRALDSANESLTAQNEELIVRHEKIATMNEKIAMLNQNLTEMNDVLERRVDQRTSELMGAHQKLAAQYEKLEQTQETLRRSAEIQISLKEIAEAAVVATSLDELYAKVHQSVGRVLLAKNFYISLLDEKAGELVIPYCVDETNTVPRRRTVGKGLTDYVMSQRRAVYVTPPQLERLRESGEVLVSLVNYNRWMGAPLIDSTGKAFGIVAVFLVAEDKRQLQPEDLEVLSIVAAQVSLAIERKEAEEALRASEERFRTIIHAMQAGIVIIDAQTHRILEANQKTFEMIGGGDEAILGSVCHSFICPAEVGRCPVTDLGQTIDSSERILLTIRGEKISILKSVVKTTLGGRPVLIESFIDITERKQAEAALGDSEARYRAVIDQAPEAVITCDPDTNEILEANTRFSEQFGYDLRRDGSLNMSKIIVDSPASIGALLEKLKQNGFLPVQRRKLRHNNGTILDVERSATMVRYRGRSLLVQTLRDVSDEVRREQEEYYQSTHDDLTGLYNRRGFAEGVAKILATGTGGALLLLDIDDFKLINDVHGHDVGDKYLAAFAAYLSANFGESALVARFGGDEFILFFEGADGLYGATRSSALMEVICLETESGSFFVQLSGGIALVAEQENRLHLQIQRAYLALHHAKESGKWCCKKYESFLQDKVSRRYAIKDALNNALANEEYHLVFQPIFEIQEKTEKIVGYEALLRWTSPKFGVISPTEFIPVAEETNLILPIGKWVLREACRFSVNIWEEFGEFVNVSVNISMRQLSMPNFVSMVKDTLHETGLPACNLSLEVTESILMTDVATRVSYLQELRDFGVAISLDDFGTGFSSFTYLAQMPITTLKIDKSMVDELKGEGNSRSRLLLESLLHLSALLGYRVVAEGVETQEQLDFLKSKGCDCCQGYLLGRPLPEAAVLEMYGEQQIIIVNQ